MNATLAESLWSGLAVSRVQQVLAVLVGTLALAISAHIQVPFWPVPMTMQTFVVLMIGAAFGARLGAATLVTYLIEGTIGLPVFASAAGLAGPTAGYLVGFLVAATLVGWLADRGHGRSVLTTLIAFVIGEVIMLGMGAGWLATKVGLAQALSLGVVPFLPAEGVKIALACALLPTLWRFARR
jgi:biotin transport system substrate-specific component